eukprot:scaffold8374_cov175-Amphora_coffeaeformis.AAC.115
MVFGWPNTCKTSSFAGFVFRGLVRDRVKSGAGKDGNFDRPTRCGPRVVKRSLGSAAPSNMMCA